MKISFVMIVFQSDYVLEQCLRSALPCGKVYAAEGPVGYWRSRGFTHSTDKTNAILNQYDIPAVHWQWHEKDEQSNAALDLIPPDTDFVWVLDSDEIWKAQDIERIIEILGRGDVDSMSFKATSFYGGFERYMTGFEENFEVHRIQRYYKGARFSTHRPPTILAPDGRPWRLHRHMNCNQTDALGLRFYHYSYVFPSQMRAKAEYYATMGGNISDYFQRVYLPWILGNDIARSVIEDEFDGVHNWQPNRRGPCRTRLFEGEHPAEIAKDMPELKARFNFELEAL